MSQNGWFYFDWFCYFMLNIFWLKSDRSFDLKQKVQISQIRDKGDLCDKGKQISLEA